MMQPTGVNVQNTPTAQTTQYQKHKQPNQKMGRCSIQSEVRKIECSSSILLSQDYSGYSRVFVFPH